MNNRFYFKWKKLKQQHQQQSERISIGTHLADDVLVYYCQSNWNTHRIINAESIFKWNQCKNIVVRLFHRVNAQNMDATTKCLYPFWFSIEHFSFVFPFAFFVPFRFHFSIFRLFKRCNHSVTRRKSTAT